METITPLVVEAVVESARRWRSTHIQEGARAITKKQGHAEGRAYASAFEGVAPTQENAERLIRHILNSAETVVRGRNVTDIYDPAGRGVRFEVDQNTFVGFLEGHLRKR